jgi:hypothetical protein
VRSEANRLLSLKFYLEINSRFISLFISRFHSLVALEASPEGTGRAIGYYQLSCGSYILQDRYPLADGEYLLRYQEKDQMIVVLSRGTSRDCQVFRIKEKRIHLLTSQVFPPPLSHLTFFTSGTGNLDHPSHLQIFSNLRHFAILGCKMITFSYALFSKVIHHSNTLISDFHFCPQCDC